MIDEAVGKILGMAMAYAVSSLGLFLAYVNYRKRKLGAAKVMTPAAWGVVAAIVLGVAGGAWIVSRLARLPASSPAETAAVAVPAPLPAPAPVTAPAAPPERDASSWPLVGILMPAVIFLLATWITLALYRHFARTTG
jgi:hypothetical protein